MCAMICFSLWLLGSVPTKSKPSGKHAIQLAGRNAVGMSACAIGEVIGTWLFGKGWPVAGFITGPNFLPVRGYMPEKSPCNMAAVGNMPRYWVDPLFARIWTLPRKKVRFLQIGPPNVPPYWLYRSCVPW